MPFSVKHSRFRFILYNFPPMYLSILFSMSTRSRSTYFPSTTFGSWFMMNG